MILKPSCICDHWACDDLFAPELGYLFSLFVLGLLLRLGFGFDTPFFCFGQISKNSARRWTSLQDGVLLWQCK
jgi:hypothetical protein